MVEFGLKLQDNKVEEWSDKYIDYEALKKILKKASAAIKKKEDLVKRKPELAEEIITAYREGMGPSEALTPFTSADGLNTLDSPPPSTHTETGVQMVDQLPDQVPTEQDKLLRRSSGKYGSRETMGSEKQATDSISNTLQWAVSGMSGYFSKSRYERQIREALKEIDNLQTHFEESINNELAKVNSFYFERLEDLDQRLAFLVESVCEESGMPPPGSVVKTHKKKRSFFSSSLVSKIQSAIVHHEDQPTPATPPRKNYFQDSELPEDFEVTEEELIGKYKQSDSIQRAMADQYRTAKLLHNFAIMNYTGFVKIVKKHDKTFKDFKGKYKAVTVASAVCNEGKDVEKLSEKMERCYADWFCDGNLLEGRAQLLPKRGDGLQMDWSQLRLGYRLGMCAILTIWVCWDCIWGSFAHNKSTIGGRTAFPVFRACGGLVLLHWFWGCSTYVWTRYRINYIFLFDFNPNIVDGSLTIFNDAVDNTLVFLICALLYYKSGAHDIPNLMPPGVYPFLLVLFATTKLIFPLRTRGPMWMSIFEVITSPFSSPKFFTIYIADVFTSMVKVFQDVAWTFGFILSGDFLIPEDELDDDTMHAWQHSLMYKNVLIPLICLFPLWMRFNQCLRRYLDTGIRKPNLLNAFKYAMSQTVTLFGAFHPLYLLHNEGDPEAVNLFQTFWMTLFVASSLYSFTWDVVMDWGLGQPQYGFLGPRLMFPRRSYYYGVIAADLVLRSMWVLSLIPPQSGADFEIPQYLTAVTMLLELLRRTMWGFFRLENEHRNNTGHYRRVDFVPLHFNTGHKHKYKHEKEHVGWTVLAEVAMVTVLVVGVSVSSVIAAQRASRGLSLNPDL